MTIVAVLEKKILEVYLSSPSFPLGVPKPSLLPLGSATPPPDRRSHLNPFS